jgi:hypothetical protein
MLKIENRPWTPRPSDVAWTASLIQNMSHLALWGIPVNGSLWRLDKEQRVFACIHGPRDDMFDRITAVCRPLGYRTAHTPEPVEPVVLDQYLHGRGKAAVGRVAGI